MVDARSVNVKNTTTTTVRASPFTRSIFPGYNGYPPPLFRPGSFVWINSLFLVCGHTSEPFEVTDAIWRADIQGFQEEEAFEGLWRPVNTSKTDDLGGDFENVPRYGHSSTVFDTGEVHPTEVTRTRLVKAELAVRTKPYPLGSTRGVFGRTPHARGAHILSVETHMMLSTFNHQYAAEFVQKICPGTPRREEGNPWTRRQPDGCARISNSPSNQSQAMFDTHRPHPKRSPQIWVAIIGGMTGTQESIDDDFILYLYESSETFRCFDKALNTTSSLTCAERTHTRPTESLGEWWYLQQRLYPSDAGRPGARSYHAAASLPSDGRSNASCVYVFGGRDYEMSDLFSDLWSLCPVSGFLGSAASTTFRWTELSPGGDLPSARWAVDLMQESRKLM